jgi:hypothetical protein
VRTREIQVYSGHLIDPIDPALKDITIEDIAHSLALQCRWTGHCARFYSIAQHSVLVAMNVPISMMLEGLLHDASEAYLADFCAPLKQDPTLGVRYREVERNMMIHIADRFGLEYPLPDEVKEADQRVLATEIRDLMSPDNPVWNQWIAEIDPLPATIHSWDPVRAEEEFKRLFWEAY